jgi:hypothetical protein
MKSNCKDFGITASMIDQGLFTEPSAVAPDPEVNFDVNHVQYELPDGVCLLLVTLASGATALGSVKPPAVL